MKRSPTRFAGVLCGLLVWCAPGQATAAVRGFHTVLQDDNRALFEPQMLPQFMAQLRWLGVDELRVSAEWKLEAPSPDSARRPAGFALGDPAAYRSPGMQMLDRAVRAAARAGIGVIIDPAFSAPRWATAGGSASYTGGAEPWYVTGIDVTQLAAWERMLARRYNGTFTPPGESAPLPRVQAFTLWNEPNELGYLAPQWSAGQAVSADWYRRLVQLAYPAIKAAAPRAAVLIGNTSAAGADLESPSGGVPPLAFIRRLACVNSQLRPVHDGGCAQFQTLPADGYAHHPYERLAPPWLPSGPDHPDWAQTGDLARLQALLDRLVALHRLAPGAQNLWLTEQGYESSGELAAMPWTEAQQAQLIAESEYLAWRDPQAMSFSQFLLRDIRTSDTLALRRRTGRPDALLPGTWTTGLVREDGVPKPALWMFRSPVLARVASGSAPGSLGAGIPPRPVAAPLALEVWGRARPARSPTLVQVQVADDATGGFRTVRETTTDANGIFDVPVIASSARGVTVRFQWLSPDGSWQSSPATAPVALP